MSNSDLDFIGQFTSALELSLGIVFLVAVIPKIHHARAFVNDVAAYRLLPLRLTWALALCVIAIESFLALAFLAGWMSRLALVLAGVLLACFSVAVGISLHRGLYIRCGCFGGESERISVRSLTRLAMISFAVVLLALMPAPEAVASRLANEGASALPHLVQVGGVAVFFILAGSWLLSLSELAFSIRHLSYRNPRKAT